MGILRPPDPLPAYTGKSLNPGLQGSSVKGCTDCHSKLMLHRRTGSPASIVLLGKNSSKISGHRRPVPDLAALYHIFRPVLFHDLQAVAVRILQDAFRPVHSLPADIDSI